ncbi:MAG: hypothetical protein ACTSQJ_17660 [Promethearchaeota archaeon]
MGTVRKKKGKRKKKVLLCNLCNTKLNRVILFMCPNCSNTGNSNVCENCDSKMDEIELFSCPSCGNTIDEITLKEKLKLKEKFEELI